MNDPDSLVRVKCDYVISAFGSGLVEESVKEAIKPLTLNKWGTAEIDPATMQAKAADWLFVGGDLAGNGTTVRHSLLF